MPLKKKKLARHYRRNMTKPEVLLWVRIKNDQLGFRIKRQYSFGDLILDFYCPSLKVDIEVDGKDHAFRGREDADKDRWLESERVTTYRIPARTILRNPDFAAEQLKEFLEELQASEGSKRDTSLAREVGERGTNEPGESNIDSTDFR